MISMAVVFRRCRSQSPWALLASLLDSRGTRALVTTASSLVGTAAVSSILGFVYWWLAARYFAPAAVGAAAAEISAMLLLGNLAVLGLGYLLIAELPRHPGRVAALIVTALVVAGSVGGFLGLLFAVVAPALSPNLGRFGVAPLTVALIAVGVGATAVGRVLDQAVLGLVQGMLQLWRNLAFAIIKLVALVLVSVLLGDEIGVLIFATWVVGELVSLGGLALIGCRGRVTVGALRPQWRLLYGLGRAALGHHAINIALQTPAYALPLVVTALLSVTANSYFYTAWLVANVLFIGPFALATALFAAGARAPGEFAHRTRLTLGLSFGGGLLASLVLIVGADPILRIFSAEYADQAATTLRILSLGVFPLIVKEHYVAICRVRESAARAAPRLLAAGGLEIAAAALGATFGGLIGLSLGWLMALALEAVLMSRRVYQAATVTHAIGGPVDVQSSSDHREAGAPGHQTTASAAERSRVFGQDG
jgi:O-antigen/teichoic acid export membrane protein